MIIVNASYAICTPESAAEGDYSETGFLYRNDKLTFRELVKLMKDCNQTSCYPASGSTSEWVSTGFKVTDYRTGEETEYCHHYSPENPPKNAKYWRLAMKAAGLLKGAK